MKNTYSRTLSPGMCMRPFRPRPRRDVASSQDCLETETSSLQQASHIDTHLQRCVYASGAAAGSVVFGMSVCACVRAYTRPGPGIGIFPPVFRRLLVFFLLFYCQFLANTSVRCGCRITGLHHAHTARISRRRSSR